MIDADVIDRELHRLEQWDSSLKNAVKRDEFVKRIQRASRLVETDLVFGVDRLIDTYDNKGFHPAALLAACQSAAAIRFRNADNWDYELPSLLPIDQLHGKCGQQMFVELKNGWLICRHCSQNVVLVDEFGNPRVMPWTDRQELIERWREEKEKVIKELQEIA